jgi:hypothetical protein
MSSVQELLAAAHREGLVLTTEHADLDRSGLDFEVCHAHDADGTPWIVRAPRRQSVVDAAAACPSGTRRGTLASHAWITRSSASPSAHGGDAEKQAWL